MNFEQIQWNKVFCRMYGLAMIEVMTMSGHLSNIDEIFFSIKYAISKTSVVGKRLKNKMFVQFIKIIYLFRSSSLSSLFWCCQCICPVARRPWKPQACPLVLLSCQKAGQEHSCNSLWSCYRPSQYCCSVCNMSWPWQDGNWEKNSKKKTSSKNLPTSHCY